MIRRDAAKPSRRLALAATIAPLLLAGCSGPTAETPPPVVPAEAPAQKPDLKKSRTRIPQPEEPGFSGKGA